MAARDGTGGGTAAGAERKFLKGPKNTVRLIHTTGGQSALKLPALNKKRAKLAAQNPYFL